MPSRAIRVGGRVLSGAVAIGGAVALVLGASLVPAIATATTGSAVTPAAVDQQRVCAGPLLQLGDLHSATRVTSYGMPRVTAATAAGGAATYSALTDSDVAEATDGATSGVFSAPAAIADGDLLAAAQGQAVRSAEAAGLAVIGCSEATASSWIVGGATDTGRSSVLLLSNPADVSAAVDLALYTADGRVQAPGLENIVVTARSQRAISLAGYAPGEAQLALEVSSRGGLVSAALQHTVVRGLEAGGVDLVGRTAGPATEQVIPGLRITTSSAAEARAHVGGSQDVETVLRLLAPREDARVTIGVAPEAAGAVGTSLEVEVQGGEVAEVPFEGLADGIYTVTITASAPVVAAARASTVAPPSSDPEPSRSSGAVDSETSDSDEEDQGIGFDVVGPATGISVTAGERIDLAWFPAGGILTRPAAFAVPDAPSPRLAVANTGNEAVTVTVQGAGETRTVEVAAGASGGADLRPDVVYLLTSSGPVSASVSYAGVGELAAHPVRSANPLATPLVIYP